MDNGSLYDQFSNHEAEPIPDREFGAFANRQDNTQPYVGRTNAPKKATRTIQEDKSYYAWWRFVSNRQPNNSFEQSVNIEFRANNGTVDGKNFDSMRSIYINLYKNMMG